jgi:hypothetical protein
MAAQYFSAARGDCTDNLVVSGATAELIAEIAIPGGEDFS